MQESSPSLPDSFRDDTESPSSTTSPVTARSISGGFAPATTYSISCGVSPATTRSVSGGVSPAIARSPVTARSISVGVLGLIDVHLLHCTLQWRFIVLVCLLLGNIGDGHSGSLKAFPRRDDDEGDHGLWVCEESAFRFKAYQRTLGARNVGW